MRNLFKLKSLTKTQDIKKVKIMNFAFISIFIFFCQIFFSKEIKANVHNYRTYTDEKLNFRGPFISDWDDREYRSEEVKSHYLGGEDIYWHTYSNRVWECPGGKTRITSVFWPDSIQGLFEKFEGYPSQNITNLNKGWNISINCDYFQGNCLRKLKSFKHYPNLKVNSISSSLFYIPGNKEVYPEDNYKSFKENIAQVIDTKNYYKLEGIYFIKDQNCKGSYCDRDAVYKFVNDNKTSYIVADGNSTRGFSLINSKNEVFGVYRFYDDDFHMFSCKGNTLIHGIVNSFSMDIEDDLGNKKRGPLLFLHRETKYELQNKKKEYKEPVL